MLVFLMLLPALQLILEPAAHAREINLKLPLSIIHRTDVKTHDFPVSAGIPFPEGMIFPEDVSGLSVVDDQGRPAPAQFDPFVLWWGKDKSVKWLRVDMMAPAGQKQGTPYFLIHKKTPAAQNETPLRVAETPEEIVVTTGPLKAVISKQRGTILESVFIDDERIIRPDPRNGIHIQSDEQEVVYGTANSYNIWGSGSGRISNYAPKGELIPHTYLSGTGRPEKVTVETQGPLRVTVLIQGTHYPQAKGRGIKSDGFYHYTVRLHFFAGKPFIKMEHAVDNNRQEYPIHIYGIRDLRLHFTLDQWAEDENTGYLIGGEKQNVSGKLENDHVGVFQDSANLERWNLHGDLKNKSKDERKKVPGYFFQSEWKIGPALFRGYKIIDDKVLTPENKLLGSGDHAPGWAALGNNKKGISVHVDRFWMECPKAIVLGRSLIEPILFPEFSPEDFQIHSGTRKSHTLFFMFHDKPVNNADTQNLAELFRYPPLLKTDNNRYATSKGLPRLWGISQDTTAPNHSNERWTPRFRYDKNILIARWKTLGLDSYDFNSGGMHGNYWPIFQGYLKDNNTVSYERGMVYSGWASESINWLIDGYSFGPKNTEPQNSLIGYGKKELFTNSASAQIKEWVPPYTTNIIGFSSPGKFHLDGEHLIHVWPFEWYYLTGSPIAKDGLTAVGNQAKYSTHRNLFKSTPKYSGNLNSAPSLDHINYYDDTRFPERVPWYFYTRIYATHLFSTAMTYAATGDEPSLFYAKWLVRRILYLQKKQGGVVGDKKRGENIPPWQESEAAIAAFELYKETGDKELLDIMGSWLEWAWSEAYIPGKGMPHRFNRGTPKEQLGKMEHHWYPGVAAPLCYAALGDPKALTMTKEWAGAAMHNIKKGEFLNKAVGQSASYVLNYLEKTREDKIPPETVSDLAAVHDKSGHAVRITWTAPEDKGKDSNGSATKYWIKISDKPIVDHPGFPDGLGKETGFYQADNIKETPLPRQAGNKETFILKTIAPHGAYGSDKGSDISELEKGTYYLTLKSWDEAGNMSGLSNVAEVKIK